MAKPDLLKEVSTLIGENLTERAWSTSTLEALKANYASSPEEAKLAAKTREASFSGKTISEQRSEEVTIKVVVNEFMRAYGGSLYDVETHITFRGDTTETPKTTFVSSRLRSGELVLVEE